MKTAPPSHITDTHPTEVRQAPYCGASSLQADTQADTWDRAKSEAELISWLYSGHKSARVQRWGQRIAECGHQLTYSYRRVDGGWRRRLVAAKLCRVRTCPICRWRRSLKLQQSLLTRLQNIMQICANEPQNHTQLRPVLLTLTVRNCNVSDLRETCRDMLRAWSRLTRRVSMSGVVGWLRTLEVTRGQDGDQRCHPHIHVLMLVNATWDSMDWDNFAWADEWGETCGLDYRPIVDIRPVTDIGRAVVEVAKYLVKPGKTERDATWLCEVALQLDRVRAMATGGLIRQVDDEPAEDDQDGTLVESLPFVPGQRPPAKLTGADYSYRWDHDRRRYLRAQVVYRTASPRWSEITRSGPPHGPPLNAG